ncbi:anti-sigma factor domain-containing protein [Glacieibacterium frigidum]|uniref:Anti-sigma K factor RskA C-terminal domain-containing protein n=1 Tax=Glacieibacterium frigidum TaxID=2593303 RepID=A0A552U9R7_9SPHN|nr:anti-sigma factor [Glacieibacterium frigidum]TRW14963.1 hypothetical protein FMM06_14985 [Glacieibacterium frigidum]
MSREPDKTWLPPLEAHLGLTGPLAGDPDRPDAATLGWVRRLLPLYERLPAAPVDMAIWERIDRSLSPAAVPQARPERRWQIATAAFAALAAGLAAILILGRPASIIAPPAAPQQLLQPLTAALLGEGGGAARPAFVVATTPGGGALRSNPGSAPEVRGHSYHLWAVTPGGHVYLGTVSPKISHSLIVPDQARALLQNGAALVISLDPATKPPAQPGRVVAEGQLARL